MINRRFQYVYGKRLHSSTLIPEREHDPSICESVKVIGQLEPFLVYRSKRFPGDYEVLNGRGRLNAFEPHDQVLVEVLELSDSDKFKICEATHKRNDRSAYETAVFYDRYFEAVRKEGSADPLSKIAHDINISLSLLSQYIAIANLFKKLAEKNPEASYTKLKHMGLNKLYELSKLTDHPKLVETADAIEGLDSASIEGIHEIVNQLIGDEKSDIEKALGEEVQGESVASKDPGPIPDLNTEFRILHEKAMKAVERTAAEMEKLLQYTNYAEPPPGLSTESKKYVEKINVAFRRINRYLQKLQKSLEPTEQDSNAS